MRLPILSAVLLAVYTTAHYTKRTENVEPTCEELRAMWQYTKRQSRAANSNTAYTREPFYEDPFVYASYEIWKAFQERPNTGIEFREDRRSADGAPIYGRMVHKAPVRSRLRNAMRHRLRASDDLNRTFGTINHFPPSVRQNGASFRTAGGGGGSLGLTPQAGSFQHLKDIIRAERARDIKDLHLADNHRRTSFISAEQYPSVQQPRKQLLSPLLPITDNLGHGRYMTGVSNIGQAWSRSVPHMQDYISR